MEEAHRDAGEFAAARAHGRLADVAREHVDARHVRQRPPEGAGERVLHQTLLQTDAQVADEQLDEVLRLRRGGVREGGD